MLPGVIPPAAAADRPERSEFSPVGDEWVCGETFLTITGGTVVFRTHVHELPSGLFRVIDVGVNRGVTATDAEGTPYRVVGVVHSNFVTPDPEEETGEEVGFFLWNGQNAYSDSPAASRASASLKNTSQRHGIPSRKVQR